MGNAVVQ